MGKKQLALLLSLMGALIPAYAAGTAAILCRNDGTRTPILQVSYSPGSDAGMPGLFWLGIISRDMKLGAMLTSQGWTDYKGGLYPFQSRYDNGLLPSIKVEIPFPNDVSDTGQYAGYSIYVGHGVYTAAMRQKVAERRASLETVKPELLAQGRWRVEFDSDDLYKWSLIEKDMKDGHKYGSILTIPYVECVPQQTGGS